jgi:hypothetical protein
MILFADAFSSASAVICLCVSASKRIDRGVEEKQTRAASYAQQIEK